MGSSGDGYSSANHDAELALSNDDSLPWLESDEYDPDEGGVDTARIVGFAIILLTLLMFAVGGTWYYSNYLSGERIVADGSTIEAPAGPYKLRPEDAGGKEFAGTGNVAPEVGEGITREAQLAERPAPPAVAVRAPTDGAPRPQIATRSSDEAAPAAGGIGVQVGAYGSRAAAEAGWATLLRQTEVLNGVSHRVVKGQADIGTVYRLQAVASDLVAARTLCQALEADGVACQVKR